MRANRRRLGLASIALAAALVGAPAGVSVAQSYSRCVDAAGRVYLTEGPPPTGVRCVAQATRELQETPERGPRPGVVVPGQHALWMTEASGRILVRTYQTEDACRVARDERVAAAAKRPPLDVAYRCLPAGTAP